MEQDVRERFERLDKARKEQAEKLWAAIGAVEARVQTLEAAAPVPGPAGPPGPVGPPGPPSDGQALAQHVARDDPHGDRAYADGLLA